VAVVATCALAAGCGEETGDDGGSGGKSSLLAGRTFVVTSIDNGGEPWGLVRDTEARLTFDDSTMGITAGCNNLSGHYRLDDDRLIVDGMNTTDMGCSKPLMKQDAWLAGLFEAPVTVGRDPLTLTSGIVELRLTDREDVSPDLSLAGTRWQLDGLVSGETVSSVSPGAEAWLEIAEDGTVALSTQCQRWEGGVTTADSTLTFGPLEVTSRACIDSTKTEEYAERTMLAVLDGEAAYDIVEHSLTVTKGQQGLTFRAE
jgi:heat shock protein HslJ